MTQHLDSRHAVYAGSFDPLTLGHTDIIRRGAGLFEKLTVAVGLNPDKQALFSPTERVDLIQQAVSVFPNVDVVTFSGLAVNFVRAQGAAVMLRGFRTLTDIDAEFTMSLANRTLDPGIETVFLMAGEKYSHISSSLIKQIAQMGGESATKQLCDFVPEQIVKPLLKKYQQSFDDKSST